MCYKPHADFVCHAGAGGRSERPASSKGSRRRCVSVSAPDQLLQLLNGLLGPDEVPFRGDDARFLAQEAVALVASDLLGQAGILTDSGRAVVLRHGLASVGLTVRSRAETPRPVPSAGPRLAALRGGSAGAWDACDVPLPPDCPL